MRRSKANMDADPTPMEVRVCRKITRSQRIADRVAKSVNASRGDVLVEKWSDAFSYERMRVTGAAGPFVDACLELGYSEDECEEIFRSTMSRYFMDWTSGKLDEIGRIYKKLALDYLKKQKRRLEKSLGN